MQDECYDIHQNHNRPLNSFLAPLNHLNKPPTLTWILGYIFCTIITFWKPECFLLRTSVIRGGNNIIQKWKLYIALRPSQSLRPPYCPHTHQICYFLWVFIVHFPPARVGLEGLKPWCRDAKCTNTERYQIHSVLILHQFESLPSSF